jgi:hypothetical protein
MEGVQGFGYAEKCCFCKEWCVMGGLARRSVDEDGSLGRKAGGTQKPDSPEAIIGRRIFLNDVDRPGERMEVEVLEARGTGLRVFVPNTQVAFDLRRYESEWLFKCSVGARDFEFDARILTAKMPVRK